MNAYKRCFFNCWEVTILDFYESYSNNGTVCRYAKCYIPSIDATEGVLLSDIIIA